MYGITSIKCISNLRYFKIQPFQWIIEGNANEMPQVTFTKIIFNNSQTNTIYRNLNFLVLKTMEEMKTPAIRILKARRRIDDEGRKLLRRRERKIW
jgi:hypothetical protein